MKEHNPCLEFYATFEVFDVLFTVYIWKQIAVLNC